MRKRKALKVADDFDEQFPGWRNSPKKPLTADQQRQLDESIGWVPQPGPKFDDDPYAEIRARDDE